MRLLAPAAAAVLLLALTGCSDPDPGAPLPTGPAPTSAPQPTQEPAATTAPPTSEPSATSGSAAPAAAPTLPPEATTNDAAGAEAFVRYWYGLFNYAVDSGDTAPLRRASLSPECLECEELASVIEEAYAAGGSLTGGRAQVVEAVAPKPDGTGALLLSVVVDQEPIGRLDEAGTLLDEGANTEVERTSQSVVIARDESDAVWQMVGLGK